MNARAAARVSRRDLILGAAACVVAPRAHAAEDELAALEARAGGRLGAAALDTGSGARLGHRGDERFAMCSTFKLALAAAVLSRPDLDLDERVPVRAEDLVPYAPITERHVGGAMTLRELCEAVMVVSDNPAANLLLARIGGPEAWTAFVRGLGDPVSRLDRLEPDLNENVPGDPRDTTTPLAMLGTMHRLLIDEGPARDRLHRWMIQCKTGGDRLRAGLPRGWRAGDKTGTSSNGAANDLAIAWPPADRAPWLIAAYYDHADSTGPARNAVLAEVARIVTTGA